MKTMPPQKTNVKSEYKGPIKLELGKLTNGEIQGTKVDLTKIKINISKENRCVK